MKKILFSLILVLVTTACSKDFDDNAFTLVLPGEWRSNGIVDWGDDLYVSHFTIYTINPDLTYSAESDASMMVKGIDQAFTSYKSKESGVVKVDNGSISFVYNKVQVDEFTSTSPEMTQPVLEESLKQGANTDYYRDISSFNQQTIEIEDTYTGDKEVMKKS